MKTQIAPCLCLTMAPDKIHSFSSILQHGFMLRTRVGHSIRTMICENFGIRPEYLEDRISTIFLDGRPVDDIDSAIIQDGSTLALSAAMPGLVGTTLRRGGHLAAFRDTITHQGQDHADVSHEYGFVTLKLFNLLIREIGPGFLEKGIWVRTDDLKDFWARQSDDFWAGCRVIRKDGKDCGPGRLAALDWPDKTGRVMLRAVSA